MFPFTAGNRKGSEGVIAQQGLGIGKKHSIERLISLVEGYRIRIDIPDEDIVFVDSIYRGRYPAEVGLLPLGEPTKADAQKEVGIAERMIKKVKTKLDKK